VPPSYAAVMSPKSSLKIKKKDKNNPKRRKRKNIKTQKPDTSHHILRLLEH
jgi:hypothetical protein